MWFDQGLGLRLLDSFSTNVLGDGKCGWAVNPLFLLRGALALQTRERKDIENSYDRRGPTAGEQLHVDHLIAEYSESVARTRTPSAQYDCHGLTFADRRTGICPSDVVRQILLQDGYRKVELSDVLPGDAVIYIGQDGEVEHSGVVVELRRSLSGAVVDTVVVSKWGGAHEAMHPSRHCPWPTAKLEYFRIDK